MPRPFRFALVLCALALFVAACSSDDGGATTTTQAATTTTTQAAPTTTSTTTVPAADPESVLADLTAAGNAGDVDALMALYADDAVVLNHPQDDDGVTTGYAEIRALEEQTAPVQGSGAGFAAINVVASGSTATFDHTFMYASDGITGSDGCVGGSGNSLALEDGKIALLEWGTDDPTLCP